MHRTQRLAALGLILALTLMAGCKAEVYHALDERSANEMVVALEQQGIRGEKVPDPTTKETWMVIVPSESRVDALSTLKAQGLPRPAAEGFGKFYPSGGLIPTSNEEHVLLQYATAQEIRRGLLTVDGVVDAHVNLVMPKKARVRLSRDPEQKTRASILIKYRPNTEGKAPLNDAQVKSLVTGGVEEILPEDISVILSPEQSPAMAAMRMEQVGPIGVDPKSKLKLQLLISLLCGAILIMGAGIGFLLIRRRSGAGVTP